jgi:hypothetical protein
MDKPVVTLTFFQYKGLKNLWWAFLQMGRLPKVLQEMKNLSFVKMLGSGGRGGFSIFPNFSLYGLLCVWKNNEACEQFFELSDIFFKFKEKAQKHQTLFLETLNAHGKWDGTEPFLPQKAKHYHQGKIAVITRATIKWNKIWHFWRMVRPASKNIQARQGLIFSVGIGELPLIQQATFSIWENLEAMNHYAYKSPEHKKVIQLTKKIGWYSEELFARFAIEKIEGEGIIPLPKNTTQNE